MARYLGPLEWVGGRWVLGDPTRKTGSCLVLTPEGMEHYEHGAQGTHGVIPWARFMAINPVFTPRAWMTGRFMGALDGFSTSRPVGGRKACALGARLRDPHEDTWVYLTHHQRRYTLLHIFWVEQLFSKTAAAGAAHRLGDPEWIAAAVDRLEATRVRWYPTAHRHVDKVLAELGV